MFHPFRVFTFPSGHELWARDAWVEASRSSLEVMAFIFLLRSRFKWRRLNLSLLVFFLCFKVLFLVFLSPHLRFVVYELLCSFWMYISTMWILIVDRFYPLPKKMWEEGPMGEEIQSHLRLWPCRAGILPRRVMNWNFYFFNMIFMVILD